MKTTVAIVEDDPKIAGTLHDVIVGTNNYTVSHVYPRIQAAIEGLRKSPPDIVLLDIAMPNDENAGVECIGSIHASLPTESIVVVVSVNNLPRTIFPCLRDGASGYFLKQDGLQELPSFLDNIRAGSSWMSPSIAARIADYFEQLPTDVRKNYQLSNREHQVIELISLGFSDIEIGKTLQISPHTSRRHVSNALQKLHAVNRAHGVRKYLNTDR